MPMIETPTVSISESIRPVEKRKPWKKLVVPIFDDHAMDCKSGIQAVLAPSMPSHAIKQNVCVGRLVGQHPRLDHQHPRFGNSSHRIDAKHRRLVDFAATNDAVLVVRGLRAVTDFDYEFQMTGMNARLNPDVETMFLMASESNQFISSRLVKEICSLGGDIGQFVSPRVMALMAAKYTT